MPRRKGDSKVNKRSSALKQKPKPKKGQQKEDEHSMVELNSRTDLHDIVRDPNVEKPIHQANQQHELKILEDLGELAQKSVQKKKNIAGPTKSLNPSDLANILSGIDDINVSKELQNNQKQFGLNREPQRNHSGTPHNSKPSNPPQDLDIEV